MALIRWRPKSEPDTFGSFLSIQDEINRLFNSALGRWPAERTSLLEGGWSPVVDVCEDESKIVVKAELPGMTEKDIEVNILDDTLTIKGEKKKEEENKEKNYHKIERSYGAFQRSIALPAPVTQEKVKASFKNGVLEIVMPKEEEARPKQIKVEIK